MLGRKGSVRQVRTALSQASAGSVGELGLGAWPGEASASGPGTQVVSEPAKVGDPVCPLLSPRPQAEDSGWPGHPRVQAHADLGGACQEVFAECGWSQGVSTGPPWLPEQGPRGPRLALRKGDPADRPVAGPGRARLARKPEASESLSASLSPTCGQACCPSGGLPQKNSS